MEVNVRWFNEYAEVKVLEGGVAIETGFLSERERKELIEQLEDAINMLKS